MDRENKGAGKNRAVFAESNWADTFSATHHFLLFTALWVADPSVFVFPWLCEYGWAAYLCMFACVWLIEVDRCWQLRRITFLLVKHHIDPVAPRRQRLAVLKPSKQSGNDIQLGAEGCTWTHSIALAHKAAWILTAIQKLTCINAISVPRLCCSHVVGQHFRSRTVLKRATM